jgi:hypothetical protein
MKTFSLFAAILVLLSAPSFAQEAAPAPEAWKQRRHEISTGTSAFFSHTPELGTMSVSWGGGYHYQVARYLQVGASIDHTLNFGDQLLYSYISLYPNVTATFGGDTALNDFFVRAGPGVEFLIRENQSLRTYYGIFVRAGKRFRITDSVSYSPALHFYAAVNGYATYRIIPLAFSIFF